MDVKKESVPPKKNVPKKRKADDDLEKDNTKYQKRVGLLDSASSCFIFHLCTDLDLII